jgi:hypothetical protein
MHHHAHQVIVKSTDSVGVITVLTFLVAIGTLATAIYGLSTWRKQLKGTHEYELAKRINLAVYELRYAIRGVRAPFVPTDAASAYQQRWESLLKPARKLKSALFEAQIIWDKEKATRLSGEMDKLLGQLNVAIDMYLMSKQDEHSDMASELFTLEQAYILYQGREQPTDNYAKSVDKYVAELERFVKPKLKL